MENGSWATNCGPSQEYFRWLKFKGISPGLLPKKGLHRAQESPIGAAEKLDGLTAEANEEHACSPLPLSPQCPGSQKALSKLLRDAPPSAHPPAGGPQSHLFPVPLSKDEKTDTVHWGPHETPPCSSNSPHSGFVQAVGGLHRLCSRHLVHLRPGNLEVTVSLSRSPRSSGLLGDG